MGAGEYFDRLKWLKRTTTKNSNNGQDEETFTDNGLLWAVIELSNGRKQTDYGTPQTGADGTIRIRNMPAVSALDRLESVEWEEVWIIENIVRGNNELICDCNKFDELTGV